MLWSESYVRVHVCLQITTRFRSLSESLAKDKAGSQGRRGQQSVEVGGSGREEDVGGSGQDRTRCVPFAMWAPIWRGCTGRAPRGRRVLSCLPFSHRLRWVPPSPVHLSFTDYRQAQACRRGERSARVNKIHSLATKLGWQQCRHAYISAASVQANISVRMRVDAMAGW